MTKFGIIPYFALMLPGWKVIEHWPSIAYIKTLVLVSCRAVSYWALYRDKEAGKIIYWTSTLLYIGAMSTKVRINMTIKQTSFRIPSRSASQLVQPQRDQVRAIDT